MYSKRRMFVLPVAVAMLLLTCACSNDSVESNGNGGNPPPPPQDTTPPSVVSSEPVDGATGVSTSSVVRVTFDESIAANSVNASSFSLVPAATGSFSTSGATASFTPTTLASGATYTVTIQGIRDASPNANMMVGSYVFRFTTVSDPPPPPPPTGDCASLEVLCVDDTPGATQEYATIQAAANVVQPGQTILVYDGSYSGFELTRSGTSTAPILIRAHANDAVINAAGRAEGNGIHLNNVNHVTIEGFTIRGRSGDTQTISGRCIAARGATATSPMTGNVIRSNGCFGAGTECFYLSQFGDALIENNTINGCGRAGAARSHGLYLANAGSDNTIIRGNTITGATNSESNGIHMNGDASIGGDGIISGLTIDGNRIYGNAQNALNMDGVRNSMVTNNLIYGNGRNGLRAYAIDGAAGPSGLKLVNNTVVAASAGWAVKLSEDGGGHTIFNNILLGTSGGLSVANTNLASNRNATDDRLSYNNEASVVTLAQWRSQTGQDADSFVSNAQSLFVNSGANDYQLADASPARDVGAFSFNGVTAPTTDIGGEIRPRGAAHDAGAYEAVPVATGGRTVYMAPSPSGNDANPGTSSQPWASFVHAFNQMGPGDTLIVKNGTYNQNLGEWRWTGGVQTPTSKPPNGTGASARTTVRGESVGGVILNGALNIAGWSQVNVEQFSFLVPPAAEGSFVAGSNYIDIRRCGFRGGIGVSGSSYIVKEDIWAWGTNRYVISNYQSDHIVDHRVIARLDDLGTPPSLPVGAISQYETDHSVIANALLFDVTGSFQQPFSLVYSSRPAIGMNRLYGIIGFNAGSQLGGIFPGDGGGGGHEVNNAVIHGTASYGVRFNSPGPNLLLNSTIFGNDGAAIAGQSAITVNNNILFNNGSISASITTCNNNLVRNSGTMSGCSGNDTSTTPVIQYLPRSPIAGKGANVETRYAIGLSNSAYTITSTSAKLWPWPYEDVIKRDMCAGRTTGWCGTSKSLTRYVWEYLGNTCPVDICG